MSYILSVKKVNRLKVGQIYAVEGYSPNVIKIKHYDKLTYLLEI